MWQENDNRVWKIVLARKNSTSSQVRHNKYILLQDAQNARPARPQRVKDRGVPLRYVEGLNDARSPLADIFGILQSGAIA